MKLDQLLDLAELKKHVMMGVVSEMKHPHHKNLVIYNYTHVAAHENIWDNITEQCRGLIVNTDTGEVIARPFRKFFNLNTSFRPETQEANLPSWKPRVLEKLDGSLGILYEHEGKVAIATRGSFWSDQAQWASKWYSENMANVSWPVGYTPLFEIIYKANRIVVTYAFEGLVLLGLVNIDTGFELSPEEVDQYARNNGFRSAFEYLHKDLAECIATETPNIEGFVLQYWSNNAPIPLRVKVKTEEYCRLHKIVTGLNPKGIWEHLMGGFDPEALWVPAIGNQPFVSWCVNWINILQKAYNEKEQQAFLAFGKVSANVIQTQASLEARLDERGLRKMYALAIQQEQAAVQATLFAMLKGADYKTVIWKQLEPKIEGKEVRLPNGDEFNGI